MADADHAARGEIVPRLRRPRPIAALLVVLAVATLLPAFLFSALLLQRNAQAQETMVETLVVATSSSILQAVERDIAAKLTTLRVLATNQALLAKNYRDFYNRTKMALEGTGTFLFVLDSDLNAILSTRSEFGTPPTRTADPETAQRAFTSNEAVVSNALLGAVSQRWVFNILQPVTLPDGTRLALALNENAEDLSAALFTDALPESWDVALVDGNGTIVAATAGAGMSGDKFTALPLERLATASSWGALDGLRFAVQQSELADWTLVTWTSDAAVTRPLSDAVLVLAIGGIVLAAVVLIVVVLVSGQIARSVRGLVGDARRLGAGEAIPPRPYAVAEIGEVADAIRGAARERAAKETEIRLLMRELQHRSKNQLTVVNAIARQTGRSATSLPEFLADFDRRISGLAGSNDLLVAGGHEADLRAVLSRQIEPFCSLESGRIRLEGPPVRLSEQATQVLGMAAHELATNAVKYGAFAVETGTLRVSWRDLGERVDLTWHEVRGAPLPGRSPRQGFGTTVLNTMVAGALGAKVSSDIGVDGITWRFALPREAIAPHETELEAIPPA